MDYQSQQPQDTLDLSAIRARLAGKTGKQFWRSLEELAETEEFTNFLQREFPAGAAEWPDSLSRRRFLKLMGASLALAGLAACTGRQPERIVPYVQAPEQIVPGEPLFFATAHLLGGFARGVLVESHEGRPTKVEGNPDHPDSLGATDAFAQASVLSLYDPDRSQAVTNRGQINTWDSFVSTMTNVLGQLRTRQGAGLRILTETITSPTLAAQLQALLDDLPQAQWHQYEPVSLSNASAGARLAFGEDVNTVYHFDQADVILSLEADFLSLGPGWLRYAREFIDGRRVREERPLMNRLYVVECPLTITGAMADHRLAVRPSQVERIARALAGELGASEGAAADGGDLATWIAAVARDLQDHRGSSLILAGNEQPPIVHALAHAMNEALGNVGTTVTYSEPVVANPADQLSSLRRLVDDMAAGQVEMLVILEGNPVYNAPADLNFGEHLLQVPLRVHLSLYRDETTALCQWHVPAAHTLESWGDARAFDGTVTILQPLIEPLYANRSAYELLAALRGQANLEGYNIVSDYWAAQFPLLGIDFPDFDTFWRTILHDGIVPGTALPSKSVSLQPIALDRSPAESNEQELELLFRPDPSIWDGRFANNAWLQELPKPLTKLTWDNAALVSPNTAERLELSNEELVELHFRDRSVRAPIWIMPGHADNAVTVNLGYGRGRGGQVATGHFSTGLGFNAYTLRTTDAYWFGSGLEIRKTGERYPLASTQHHHSMEGRDLVRVATIEEFIEDPDFAQEVHGGVEEGGTPHVEESLPSLYPEFTYEGYAWGMAIDLNACIGCNACVVACQAENNVPVVGKEEVITGREMHWLRIDRYYEGDLDDPNAYFQPMLCQHCEKAPCEVVCPTLATVHSSEGLNEMIYNRCVGTRYCSNNCPYKVRRFNFLDYVEDIPSLNLARNPDVTVRTRGVMEKCTYCVQRINAARIEAKKENRAIRDGEVVTACAAACPTRAIVFGDINDPDSHVSRLKSEPLNYSLLVELNTQPRTSYLARLRNPNPEMEEIGD